MTIKKPFNFDSFYNKSILNGTKPIIEVLQDLSDEEFEQVCSECKVMLKEIECVSIDTGVHQNYGYVPVGEYKIMTETICKKIVDAAELYKDHEEAGVILGVNMNRCYTIEIRYLVQSPRVDQEIKVARILQQRRDKTVIKLLQAKNKKSAGQKTVTIEGVEYILTPKV